MGVVPAVVAVDDHGVGGGDGGGSEYGDYFGAGVEGGGVGEEVVFWGCADDVVFEVDVIGHGVVYAAYGGEGVVAVDDLAAVVEVGFVELSVVVEVFGVEPCLSFVGADVLAYFGEVLVAEVGELVAVEVDGVVLDDVDVAVADDHVGVVVHIGAVAVEYGASV